MKYQSIQIYVKILIYLLFLAILLCYTFLRLWFWSHKCINDIDICLNNFYSLNKNLTYILIDSCTLFEMLLLITLFSIYSLKKFNKFLFHIFAKQQERNRANFLHFCFGANFRLMFLLK